MLLATWIFRIWQRQCTNSSIMVVLPAQNSSLLSKCRISYFIPTTQVSPARQHTPYCVSLNTWQWTGFHLEALLLLAGFSLMTCIIPVCTPGSCCTTWDNIRWMQFCEGAFFLFFTLLYKRPEASKPRFDMARHLNIWWPGRPRYGIKIAITNSMFGNCLELQ